MWSSSQYDIMDFGDENMDRIRINSILEAIAISHHTTVDQVRKEILFVMEDAQQCEDPLVQARWARIPRSGEKPTVEELITYITDILR